MTRQQKTQNMAWMRGSCTEMISITYHSRALIIQHRTATVVSRVPHFQCCSPPLCSPGLRQIFSANRCFLETVGFSISSHWEGSGSKAGCKLLSTMVAFKFDPVDLIFSAGGAVAAMMILHFVHTQVRRIIFLARQSSKNSMRSGILLSAGCAESAHNTLSGGWCSVSRPRCRSRPGGARPLDRCLGEQKVV